jgi:cytochrome c553
MANFPRLAGVGTAYLRSQLEAFASGVRKNPIMQPIAQALTPEQRGQVAAYFSSLPAPPASSDRTARAPAETGAWLATRGRWEDAVPACAQCHGPGGMGVGESFPPLAGQPAAYLAGQLKAWQSGARPPGPLGLMEAIARKLSAADIQAVSDYYAGIAGAVAGSASAAAGPRPGGSTP